MYEGNKSWPVSWKNTALFTPWFHSTERTSETEALVPKGTSEEGDLSCEWMLFTFPRMSAVFWTDLT